MAGQRPTSVAGEKFPYIEDARQALDCYHAKNRQRTCTDVYILSLRYMDSASITEHISATPKLYRSLNVTPCSSTFPDAAGR